MNRNARTVGFLVLTLAVLGGCSSGAPTAKDSKNAGTRLDRILGKAQVLVESAGATNAALNAGGSSVYIWEGTHRFRLFLKSPVEVTHGDKYVADGIWAQKAIDEIGDPDQGKNGYPLLSSCKRVITMAWGALSFDLIDSQAQVLRAQVKRYPARAVFLVTRMRPLTAAESAAAEPKKDEVDEKNLREVSVAADKQRAFLIEGPTVQTAPLWEPAGGTASCKVVIDSTGKISELETGAQLCESVQWAQFRYQPPVQGGHPVKVSTEVEVRFEPRK